MMEVIDEHKQLLTSRFKRMHTSDDLGFCPLCQTLAVDIIDAERAERVTGAAQRRRERRLRAWQRHVRTAVQLTLAEKLPHSACRTHLLEKEWIEQHAVVRGEKARVWGLEMESFPHCPLRGLSPPSPSGELASLAHA